MALSPNTTILNNKYTIVRQLGKGAFAHVWLAEDHAVRQQVAIKELRRAELSGDEFADLSRRFQREARIGRALEHPNIIRVYTVEQWGEDLLLVMAYVEGETLRERLDRQGPLPLETALDVAMQLCDALDAVHEHPLGIVHRDLKPSNILLSQRGEGKLLAKLTDFGLAQLAAESGRSFGSGGHHPGTPLYMAPEQERGLGYLTGRADIYALGLTVGEMLTGRPVKPRLLEGDAWANILTAEPNWLAAALEKATAREWEARYRRAGELKAALQAGLRGEAEARQRARREAEERARQEKLAKLYGKLQTALQARRWQEAIGHAHDITALDASYRDAAQLRAQAAAGLRAEREAEARKKQEQAELSRLYEAAQAALGGQDWGTVLQRCEEMARLQPGYRDVAQMKAQAESGQREQREDEERERRRQAQVAALYEDAQRLLGRRKYQAALHRMTELRRLDPAHPDPQGVEGRAREGLAKGREVRPFPWAAVWAVVVMAAVIAGTVWGVRRCSPPPTPQIIEKVVKETVLVEVTQAAEARAEATPASRPTNTATPAPPPDTPVPEETLVPPQPVAGATRVWEKDGSIMVYVPAGEFIMGSPEGEGDDDEQPQHTVYVSGFWMDQTEVTNEQFARFVEATGHSTDAEKDGSGWGWTGSEWGQIEGADWRHPDGPETTIADKMDHPVVQVSWADAQGYCQWAGKRLPTEAEWEKAARGMDGRTYPWGDAFDGSRVNFCDVHCEFAWKDSGADDGYERTAPGGSYPAGASPYGALDMAGNVWEWCQDWCGSDYYARSPSRDPQGPDSGDGRVVRGGSWYDDERGVRAADRDGGDPGGRNYNVGFRCVSQAP